MWTQQQLVQPVPPLKLFHSFQPSNHAKIQSLSKLNSTQNLKTPLTLEELPPNALRRKKDAEWRGGFSLGVDLGMARTGIALSKGFTFRPLTVLKLRGQKLEVRIMNIAEEEEADEFIIGLPKSSDGEETIQSNIVRSVAGRLAIRAAERGWRVYLHDEYGTTNAAIDRMINMGVNRSQQKKQDAYAAVMLLERYFSTSGQKTELVVPKNLELQGKLRTGPPRDDDYFSDED
ncbi:putative pre-16S rRNA nuclease, ribonuclease H-like domain-containing protein [Medicago truncatula]|uniref:Holliday junction resolvase-like protein n=1 Tax=Medicago truncatula TaxID=3880 RepID=A0A072UJ99_MEDTR|nr:putative pre-16S rRNA nuclease [Medicago truncatula]KEH29188.1 holliday junction resolvase-like protein [Medicago truncatula]RHN59379.1 putative pre-16S rRNA nuclease, ribonuclease H-like domain-containing protein [Medicago truncatula]